MLTDMRRCILANVGSAVLALSTFLTVFKEEEQKERLLLHCVLIFFFAGCQNSWFTCCLLSLHNTALCKHYNTALHCTEEHCNALESLASTRRRLPLLLPPALDSTRLVSFTAYASTVHGACKSTKQISLTMPATNRATSRVESSWVRVSTGRMSNVVRALSVGWGCCCCCCSSAAAAATSTCSLRMVYYFYFHYYSFAVVF